MAKQGFTYYKAETDRFQDIKIKRLKKRHGCAGYAVYQYLLNEIYRVRGYFLRFTADEEFDLAEYWALDEEVVIEIVEYCAEIGLFSQQIWKEKGILTARSIQTRYIDICKVCKKTPAIEDGLRLVETEQSAPAAPATPQLFTGPEMSPMRIMPRKGARGTPAPATEPTEETPPQGIGKEVLAGLAAKEADVHPEDFQKLPEVSGNFSEESDKSIKSYTSETKSSSNSPREEADKAPLPRDREKLRLLLQSMGVPADDMRWICTIEGIEAEDSPLWSLAEEIKHSGGRLTVFSYLTPSLRALVAAGRLKIPPKTVDTSAELRRMLTAIKVASYDIDKILAAAQGQEPALREAIEEVRRSKGKITLPARFLLSQLRKLMPAKAG